MLRKIDNRKQCVTKVLFNEYRQTESIQSITMFQFLFLMIFSNMELSLFELKSSIASIIS